MKNRSLMYRLVNEKLSRKEVIILFLAITAIVLGAAYAIDPQFYNHR